MTNTRLALLFVILLGGCATQPQSNGAPADVVSAQPPFEYSEKWRHDSEFIEKQRSLEKQYGSALAQSVEELLGGLEFPSDSKCHFSVASLPGGLILRTDLSACQFEPTLIERMRVALVGKTMPYAGFESVFQRTYRFSLCAPKGTCAP